MDKMTQTAGQAEWTLDRRTVLVTHLDKLFWPADGVTKGEMLEYYRDMAEVMLPHFRDRPLTLRVFPEGIHGFSFYRRDAPEDTPAWLRTVDYQPKTTDEVIQLLIVEDAAGLVWLANQGAIEFHLWTSRLPALPYPDMAVFDLDPGDQADFGRVLQAALRVRDALQALGLRCYPKTSGGRGMHIYVPLEPAHPFDFVREWVKGVAHQLAAAYPDEIAVAHGPTHRGAQVTIDHAQNSLGRNTAAVYTLRAQPHAPVSTPLRWEEVEAGDIRPEHFTIRTVPARVVKEGDLFAGVLQGGQTLPVPP
jgi:bifunctional non-homologous end joining protein LigD